MPSARVALVVIALSVAAGAYLSREAANSANAFSVFWPPAGISFAALQVFGAAALVPLAAGIAAWAALTFGADPVMIPFAVAASVAGPWCGVQVQRMLLDVAMRRGEAASRLRSLVSFYAAEALVGAPVAALLGTQGLRLAGLYPGESATAVFAAYWLVECLGALLFAPAVAELLAAPRTVRRLRFDAPTLAGAVLLALLCRTLEQAGEADYAKVMTYLFLPLVAFCGIRCDARTSHWTLVACAALILTVLAFGAPPRLEPGLREFALFESALVVFAATALAQVLQAVSEDRRGALAAVAKAAREDPATGLLNDRGLDEALKARLVHSEGPGFGVIGVRLRNLDAAVDLLDAREGVQLAAAIGQILGRVPGAVVLARPEPSRFAVLCAAPDPGYLNTGAEQLLRELESVRVAAGGVAMRLAPAVGVVWADPQRGLQADLVRVAVRDAELAAALHVERPLHAARLDGGLLAAHRARVCATERVREAILSRRLLLLAQPIAPNRPGLGDEGFDVEVLTRLVDPAGVVIEPAEFLPAVAAANLAVDLDRAVVSCVFDWFAANPHALERTAKCAINLSATSLSDPAFPGFVGAELAARALRAGRLAFEITESSALLNPTQAAGTLARLRAMGFRVALDDFGTGLSTFDYLKKLPVDYIKIDGSFIRDVERDPVDAEIVAAIVRVAGRCGLATVAEYVSSEALRQHVTALGVDYSQGWAVGKPVPLAQALS